MAIRFGTDGWRAVISEDFTFDNVRHVAQAIADYINSGQAGGATDAVVVGFDTRFLSDRYALTVAGVLAANGLPVYLSKADCPTPALSLAVKALGAAGGVMITASHNPPRYNGIKFKSAFGGSAMPEVTGAIERLLERNLREGRLPRVGDVAPRNEGTPAAGEIVRFDPMPMYLRHLRTLIDFAAIARSGLRVAVDPMYGAGRGYIARWLRELGVMVAEIHGELNPGFGGLHPEPIGRNLQDLQRLVLEGGYDIGLATDGDADRIGAIDARGEFVSPHMIIALALKHLLAQGKRGLVVKTISTTQIVNRLARQYDLAVEETPVGFNYICDYMLKQPVLIGGEESGGISILGHIPEGDGILMGLLLLEIVAQARQPLHTLIAELQATCGPFFYDRIDRRVRPFSKRALVQALTQAVPATLADQAVVSVNDRDGVKYLLADDSWLLIRPSGTEPVLRIYAEARTPELVQQLLAAGVQLAERSIPTS
ncbi:phosphoglucomutase/phosphomannomutase family protein [Kallotenue papyrolyticum]|uniref:phosphoglucomutase/phosphomannomutase family protein n=1 Tax=Kallotenue papyrolyticum TaxID=1325125 RepID=UPI000492C49B|nr:phosphoglucomutase/phosphomannomutase family protein [Kallotenue papyrolyticum]